MIAHDTGHWTVDQEDKEGLSFQEVCFQGHHCALDITRDGQRNIIIIITIILTTTNIHLNMPYSSPSLLFFFISEVFGSIERTERLTERAPMTRKNKRYYDSFFLSCLRLASRVSLIYVELLFWFSPPLSHHVFLLIVIHSYTMRRHFGQWWVMGNLQHPLKEFAQAYKVCLFLLSTTTMMMMMLLSLV